MLINIPSQRQVCSNSGRGRVRGREKNKKGKRTEGLIEQVNTLRQVVPLLTEEEQAILHLDYALCK